MELHCKITNLEGFSYAFDGKSEYAERIVDQFVGYKPSMYAASLCALGSHRRR